MKVINIHPDDKLTLDWYADWLKKYRKARAEGDLNELEKLIKESESHNLPLKDVK